jgi:hypothetical protein
MRVFGFGPGVQYAAIFSSSAMNLCMKRSWSLSVYPVTAFFTAEPPSISCCGAGFLMDAGVEIGQNPVTGNWTKPSYRKLDKTQLPEIGQNPVTGNWTKPSYRKLDKTQLPEIGQNPVTGNWTKPSYRLDIGQF